jgi:oxepin-CoA hydrolase/3-oxo-5,6-dehydrosuberyl-CoA semialdehyde dehydrogenase
MKTLASYLGGAWKSGSGKSQQLVDPSTEEVLAETSTSGLDLAGALAFARETGGPALRRLTFAQRGEILQALSRAIHAKRDELLDLAMANGGNTRGDAKFDVDGASGTLAWYAGLGKELGAERFLVDGDAAQLGRSPRFVGQHAFFPRRGVAVHVNAFNFPAWGLGEKLACAILGGMPVVAKPATSTALVAHRIAELFVETGALPEGAFQLVAGPAGDLLEHLRGEDVLSFTGGGSTASTLRAMAPVTRDSVRVNVEADSLNAAVLGADVEPGSDTWNAFLRDVARDVTQKTGQKCTAIRRVFVPSARLDDVVEALVDRLREVRVGDPRHDGVGMGPVATANQLRDVRAGIERLAAEAQRVLGDGPLDPLGAPAGKGYFVPPTVFVQRDPSKARAVHEHEVFGPAVTVLPADGAADAAAQVRRGGGGLVASLYTDDRELAAELVVEAGSSHGRIFVGSAKVVDQTAGPGTVLPQTIHGGPGRAGGGEELGGVRGLAFYAQRVAVQGDRPVLDAIFARR